jgi:hypothetical protein
MQCLRFGALLFLHQSAKIKAALCTPICPASAMAAPKNATSNGSDF